MPNEKDTLRQTILAQLAAQQPAPPKDDRPAPTMEDIRPGMSDDTRRRVWAHLANLAQQR